jgi:2,3-bisphosphoglycerate-independent phosphoglycerate mutase
VVLDGYGIGSGDGGDATRLADTPFFDRAARLYPMTRVETSGRAVGLADGQAGNSEIGHLTLGAGRIIEQELIRTEARRQLRPSCDPRRTGCGADSDLPVLFGPAEVRSTLGEIVGDAGLRQLRIAETEKYPHVTCCFSGGREVPFPGEDHILVPSPRDVPSYDLKPEMSAVELTDRLVETIENESYAFILLNYANPDMVGHTGAVPAGVRAVEVIDACLDRVCPAVLERGGTLLVTSDHGNVGQLVDPRSGGPHTAHTTNPVPLYWVTADAEGRGLAVGGLPDLAPTLCELLELPAPEAMTGRSLLR